MTDIPVASTGEAAREETLQIAPNPPRRALSLHRELHSVWSNDPGWRGQITAVNHTTLGLRFMGTALVFFAIGGVLAMLIRAQLSTPAGAFLDTELYNQIFTMHGSIMMFLFAIPMLEGLAIYLLPKMLGTRDMAFPRLTALGYWCYLFGGLILLAALLAGVAPRVRDGCRFFACVRWVADHQWRRTDPTTIRPRSALRDRSPERLR